MDIQAVNKFKEKQKEKMRQLKSDYASKMNSLKQAKKALQQRDFDKENFSTNAGYDSRNQHFPKFGDSKKPKQGRNYKNCFYYSNYSSEDEPFIRKASISPIRSPLAEMAYKNKEFITNGQSNLFSIESSLNNSIDIWNSRKRRDFSAPKYPLSNSVGRNRSNYFTAQRSSINETREYERMKRNRKFVQEVKQKRNYNDLSSHLEKFSKGFRIYLNSNQFNDIKDKIVILLNQADALYEKFLHHLCNLSLNRKQEERYREMITEYRETFRQLKISYCVNEDMLIANEIQNQPGNIEDNESLINNFKTDLGLVFKQSLSVISQSFDDCFHSVSDMSSNNKAMCAFKMREIDSLFDTLVTSFYKNKLLSMIPDLVFTLESTRLSKGVIISHKLLESKHKTNLRKGFDSFRRNVSRFYIAEDKMLENQKTKHLACTLFEKIAKRKERSWLQDSINSMKYNVNSLKLEQAKAEMESQLSVGFNKINDLEGNISYNREIIHHAQQAYKLISAYANNQVDSLEEDDFDHTLQKVCEELFRDKEFTLKCEEIVESAFDDETLNFKWKFTEDASILHLSKNTDKTHQYKLYFGDFSEEETEQVEHLVGILKILINMLSWIKTLKYLNCMLMNDEILPLQQDCKTLNAINNARAILEEANSYEEFDNNINIFAANTRELQDFLQDLCTKVFSSISLETECSIFLNEDTEDFKSQSEETLLSHRAKKDKNKRVPLAELYSSDSKVESLEDFSVDFSEEIVVLKTPNIIVEAKVLPQSISPFKETEFAQTFNPADNSQISSFDPTPINPTSKEFICRLLKNYIDDLFLKVVSRREMLQKELEKDAKIAEQENEIRLMKEWSMFSLSFMNKPNIMDSYETCSLAIEKYLINELAKYSEIDDLNIYYSHDYRTLLKIIGDKEHVQEEIHDELYQNITDGLAELESTSETNATNCLSFLCNQKDQYFVMHSELSVPERVTYIIKIEYKNEGECMSVINTLQILSNQIILSLSHFLNDYYKSNLSMIQTNIYQVLLEKQKIRRHGRPLTKEDCNKVLDSASDISMGMEAIDKISDIIPKRMFFNYLKSFASKSKKVLKLGKLSKILLRRRKKEVFQHWKKALDLWKKKIASLKKLFQWNRMKITSKVLHKWYTHHKYQESMIQSVYHKDYVISMYEILGNCQSSKQFADKFYGVFVFMLNRYLRQVLGDHTKKINKMILTLRNENNDYFTLDLTEQERGSNQRPGMGPINLETSQDLIQSVISPIAPNINQNDKNIFIDEPEFSHCISPQNYSVLISSNKCVTKGKYCEKVDSSTDYIVSRCMENPYCSKITNKKILIEALNNRLENPKIVDSQKLIHSICSCFLVPIIINLDEYQEGNMEEPGFELSQYLGNLELYFNDKVPSLEASKFEEQKPLSALYPIFKLLKDLLSLPSQSQEDQEESLTNLDMSKIEETKSHLDHSHVSISASFLSANKRTSQDSLLSYSQSTKPLPSFSHFLSTTSTHIPKILTCQKSLLHFIIPTTKSQSTNIFNIPQKTAYFYSFTDKHVFNFNYEGTFVQKIIDNQTPVTFVGSKEGDKEVSIKSVINPGYPRSIMNEPWFAIRYLPVFVGQGKTRTVRGILETCYNEPEFQILITQEQAARDGSYISEIAVDGEMNEHDTSIFSGLPDSVAQSHEKSELSDEKIIQEHKNVEDQCTKIVGKRLAKYIKNLKSLEKTHKKCQKKLEKYEIRKCFSKWASILIQKKDQDVIVYRKEIIERESRIEDLQRLNVSLNQDLYNKDIQKEESQTKLKGAAKIFIRINARLQEEFLKKKAFETWRADFQVNRIMENAFNKVLEINHKHVNARVSSAVNLLNSVFSRQIRSAFGEIYLSQSTKPEMKGYIYKDLIN